MFAAINLRQLAATAAFAILVASSVLLSGIFLRAVPVAAPVFGESSALAERVLVIDAGHGGEDGGASASGLVESGINLDIARRLEALAGFCGIKTAMTRESETIEYPASARTVRERKAFDQRGRIALINSFEDAVLISIHQNKYPDSRPRGSQVFFSPTDGSRELAELAQARLTGALYPENRRLASKISDTILIMKSVECPAILVECAFLSNAYEAEMLKTPEYKQKIALALLASYLDYESMPPELQEIAT